MVVPHERRGDDEIILPKAILNCLRPLRYEVDVPHMGPSKQFKSINSTYPSNYTSCTAIQGAKIDKHWIELP